MASNKDFNNSKDWIILADEDLGFASTNLEDEETSYFSQICFHFQQAAEKYLKAYVVANNLEFRKIHELPTLLMICQKHNQDFENLKENCDFLTEFYFETRYPAHMPISRITREMAKKAEESVKHIRNFVKGKLKIK